MPASISVLDSTGASQTVNTLPALGQEVKSASLPVAIASDDDIQAKLGILTETAPSTDTGSSGLNGRLQRLAQRLTSLIALLPATLGQTTKAASLGVALASDDPVVTAVGAQADVASANGASGSAMAYLRAIKDSATSNASSAVTPDPSAYALIPAPSTYRLLSAAASTNGANIKGSAGAVKGIQGQNAKASPVYLKLYNKATAPTVGTDTPVKTLYLAPSAQFAFSFATGLSFSAGIGIALTGAAADADTTALVAGDILCLNVDYH